MAGADPEQKVAPSQTKPEAAAEPGLPQTPSLEKFARVLAEQHSQVASPARGASLYAQQPGLAGALDAYRSLFQRANQYFRGASDQELSLSYAAEWMLDNYYIIQQSLRLIEEDMPARFYRQLPVLAGGEQAGQPRVYALAHELIRSSKAHLDLDRVQAFLRVYESVTPLTMGELWALPVMLRLGTLQGLLLSVCRIINLPVSPELPTLDLSGEVKDDDVVANSFLSLRALAAQDWKTFFESLSQVELALNRDPAGLYAHMDFETRDQYRKVVEKLALSTGRDEQDVAREALRLAQAGLDRAGDVSTRPLPRFASLRDNHSHRKGAWSLFAAPVHAHVGHYLLGGGRGLLEERIGFRPTAGHRLQRWVFEHPTAAYLGSIAGATLLVLLAVAALAGAAAPAWLEWALAALLAVIPAVTIAVNLVNWVVTNAVPPKVLPKMDFSESIPVSCDTLIAVPALLTSERIVRSLLRQLEQHYLRNPEPGLSFALLTDLSDASAKETPEDAALIEQASQGVQRLNEQYAQAEGAGPFYLLHRERLWNEKEGVWMGWERKRGKLHELNRLIAGQEGTTFSVQIGDMDALRKVRYVITLDADTILPRDSAPRLIATLSHPLNRAEFDPRTGEVVSGYTVLQPRTEISATSANQSLFTRIFAGDTGLDLYTLAVSDVYQDLFGEGSYVGKGIYDVAAFERSLEGRVPENALLSHDLFEGVSGRAGLVTDVVLIEDYPAHYLMHTSRLERWIRGDWQLVPWLFHRMPAGDGRSAANRLSKIDRWKILDNLRRSLVPPALLALLFAAWFGLLPGRSWGWTLFAAAALGTPMIIGLLSALFALLKGNASRKTFRGLVDSLARWLLAIVFLPYEALISMKAILTTLGRVYFTHRNLLRWTTAAQAATAIRGEDQPRFTWKHMISALILAAAGGVLVALVNRDALPAAAFPLVAWMLSPEVAYSISQPLQHTPEALSEPERQALRRLALRTWIFFQQFIGPEDHWLPPDHFQESPLGAVAHRTSPTNIGLALLSSLAAYDLGYLETLNLGARLRSIFDTLAGMERYRGHFINWYDTRTLQPLPPAYVSTVDSGNLAASFIALGQGLMQIPDQPILRWETLEGILDSLALISQLGGKLSSGEARPEAQRLNEVLDNVRQSILELRDRPASWPPMLYGLACEPQSTGVSWDLIEQRLLELVEARAAAIGPEDLRRLRIYAERARHRAETAVRELDVLVPWLAQFNKPPGLFGQPGLPAAVSAAWQDLQTWLDRPPTLAEVSAGLPDMQAELARLRKALDGMDSASGLAADALRWCSQVAEGIDAGAMAAKALLIGFQELNREGEAYTRAMDFTFLFDPKRQVFHIGYNMMLGRLDSNFYDLLASEARIASLVAIGKGDVPQSHWLHLARPLTQVDGYRALLSWSATMFEYLMPVLLLRSYDGTLLSQSNLAATARQIEYGKEKGVPWGISESGYYRFDANMVYQYRAFGVPGLGYKRGLGDDLVITPYASLLALPLSPRAVVENLADLEKLGMTGVYGLYEAVDFTANRLSLGNKYEIVREYMAHHQGMILLSLANYFRGEVMVKRFHSNPRIRSVELLLQEQIPENPPLEQPHVDDMPAIRPSLPRVDLIPWWVPVEVLQPRVHFLSNGRYGVMIASAGGGYSTWMDRDLTRWRADTTLGDWGTWLYIQDQEDGALWSAGLQPSGVQAETMDVSFNAHLAEFRRMDQEISTTMELVVAPDDDVEIRRVTLTNHSDRPRRLRLTSYGEVILAAQAADARHPAFNKMFIESEWSPDLNALLFRRRPRSDEETPIYLAHALVPEQGMQPTGEYCSDRAAFLGRGRTVRHPAAVDARVLAGSVGATLDPVMAIAQEVSLKPHGSAQVSYLTLAGKSRQEVYDLVQRYRAWYIIDRTFELARSQAEIELRQLGLNTGQVEHIQTLLSLLLYPSRGLRPEPVALAANEKGQPGLWAFGISGDYPILLLHLHEQEDLSLAHELLQAHAYWRNRRLMIDLVIINEQGTDYGQELTEKIHGLLARTNSDSWLNRRGGIYLVPADRLGTADRTLLEAVARAVLDTRMGSLAEQLEGLGRLPARLPAFYPSGAEAAPGEETPPVPRPEELSFDNGWGGFSLDGREYQVYLEPGRWTPAPWINVIANPEFGFLASEAGGGYTWAVNSGENRLTPWSNDPVTDTPGEALYLRDEETAEVWSPTPLPAGAPAPYLVRHGAGYTIYEHNSHGLKQRLRLFVSPEEPVKVLELRLENIWDRPRRITATSYAEWVLGVSREDTQQYVIPEFEGDSQALLARNPYNVEFGGRVAFAAASKPLHGLTADRTEFLGRQGSRADPAALRRIGLVSTVEAGLDPCAALQLHIDLPPGGVEQVHFLLGQGSDRDDALRLVGLFKDEAQVEAAWEATGQLWDRMLGAVSVQTPDPALDLLLNRWLLYESLSCRTWGRSAFYQSSGAYGFRDQLQDVMALVFAAPELAREHILRSAGRQFEAGDVLHWWHPPSGRGVRTRFSDDLLWLPFVTAHYVLTTGDLTILDEKIPFLKGPLLEPGQDERYDQYPQTKETFTLYEHCRRAIEKGATSGSHRLPLMGTGDWNDGMNLVGAGGRGESVWLGWFLYAVFEQFAQVCDRHGSLEQAESYRQQAAELSQAIEAAAWDGAWYLRAFYDDGLPLGSSQSRECRIDSIAQSWAALSGAGDPQRTRQAMQSLADRLVLPDEGLILLFTPPFDKTPRNPGYIKGYLPGIRENGGQYTHAAIWTVWAYATLGQGDRAYELFRLINPVLHGDTSEKVETYRVEPYVVAADVYSIPPHTGRGGWTWYTGSSGWMYRLGVEAILGLRREGQALRVEPCIPPSWSGYQMVYRYGSASYHIRVENPSGASTGPAEIRLDGRPIDGGLIPLQDDGQTHEVSVIIAPAAR